MSEPYLTLEKYLVPGTSSTYYIPEFVTEDEEDYLIRKVSGLGRWLRQQSEAINGSTTYA